MDLFCSNYINSNYSVGRLADFTVFCDFACSNASSFKELSIYAHFDNVRIIGETFTSQEQINISSQISISSGICKISIFLEFYGDDLEIEIKDLFYQISYSSSQKGSSSPLYGVDWILALYGLMILTLTEKSIRHRKLKNKSKEQIYDQ